MKATVPWPVRVLVAALAALAGLMVFASVMGAKSKHGNVMILMTVSLFVAAAATVGLISLLERRIGRRSWFYRPICILAGLALFALWKLLYAQGLRVPARILFAPVVPLLWLVARLGIRPGEEFVAVSLGAFLGFWSMASYLLARLFEFWKVPPAKHPAT